MNSTQFRSLNFFKKKFIILTTLLSFLGISVGSYNDVYEKFTMDLCSRFLLSTNFFINKMDTEQKLEYAIYFNPYVRACSNPFFVY